MGAGFKDLSITEAGSFYDVLALNSQLPGFDLILLDLAMPGMDGFAGVAMVREHAPNVPLVIVSASERREDVLRALDLGVTGYISKSMTGRELLDAISSVLAGKTFLPTSLMKSAPPPAPGDLGAALGSSNVLSGLTAEEVHFPGIFGSFPDAVIPGLNLIEGGQVSTGSILSWFKRNFALDLMEGELDRRGVTREDIAAHDARQRAAALTRPDGTVKRCDRCDSPAIHQRRGWHKIYGWVPVFRRTFYACEFHRPAPRSDETV